MAYIWDCVLSCPEDITGQRTTGTIRHVEGLGLSGFEEECETNWGAEAVTGPTCEGKAHATHNDVRASQHAIGLSGCVHIMAIPGEPLNRHAGLFLGGIIKDHPHDLTAGDTLACQADDVTPELPSWVVEGQLRKT